MFNNWRRKILDKFGGTSTIDESIMVFGLHEFCYLVANSLKYIIEYHRTHVNINKMTSFQCPKFRITPK